MGYQALLANTTASYNTVIGKGAGVAVTTGGYNVCIGVDCGDTLTTGSTNILIGNTARTSSASGSHQISMGVVATCVGDNNFTFGNQTTDSNIAFGATVITAPSDIRLKEDIQDEEIGLDFIKDLRPVTFLWKKEKDCPPDMKVYKEGSEKRVMNGKYNHGFIAQEVKATIDAHGFKEGFDMWQEDELDGRQRVAPSAIMSVMVKAVQELSTQVDELKSELLALKGE
jgi:trimeric autotransporter adhesin